MTVYVDEIREYPPSAKTHYHTKFSHMWADDIGELHAMAHIIGLKIEWFQSRDPFYQHYDVTPSKRDRAIQLGAQFKPAREYVREVMKIKGLLK